MSNTIYLTAGLPVAKDSGQSPSSGVNTFYLSAGLPPEVIAASASTMTRRINQHFLATGSYGAAQVQA